MATTACARCAAWATERAELLAQLAELTKLVDLQSAQLGRYKTAAEADTPNQPERVPKDQLQLAFEEVLASIEEPSARDALAEAAGHDQDESEQPSKDEPPKTERPANTKRKKGRRKLDLTSLAVETVTIDPDEVAACNGEGYTLIGAETSDRVAYRPAAFFRLRVERRKWRKVVPESEASPAATEVVIANPPSSLWPYFMADPSAIAQGLVAKYDDSLPTHRQQRISRRHGFEIPRSTLCGWFKAAHAYLHHIVEAMFREAKAHAFCIGTDATSAPVRPSGGGALEPWQVFVFVADHDHVIFRHCRSGTSKAVSSMFDGFTGHVVADAAPVFDVLYRDHGMTEVGCWSHMRRYFWKALGSHPKEALQFLALISKLFLVARTTQALELPERTRVRAQRARQVLDVFDRLAKDLDPDDDPRSSLAKAIGYYRNQRPALHRFLDDGRLPMHNNASESGLRNLVLGRHNWMFFETETGLDWYTTFRSLIASCHLHGINPQDYLHEVLRLVPNWKRSRVIELAPKHWSATRSSLSPAHAKMITAPWMRSWPTVSSTAPPVVEAA